MAWIYLHVGYDEKYYGVFWLYVGAGMEVKSRIAQHYKFRYTLAEVVYIITYGMCPADKTFFVRWFRSRTSGVQ